MPDSNHNSRATVPLTDHARRFIDHVMAQNFRLVVFDCDDTLWAGDNGKAFLFWEIANDVLPSDVAGSIVPRYASYERGEVGEEQMCGEMVSLHQGLSVTALEKIAARFYDEVISKAIFPEMLELTHRLRDAGCELWAVSSTNEWVIREGVRRFGISPEKVLAASVVCNRGLATKELRRVPTGAGKAAAIREVIGRAVDAVFGNSMHDAAMLELARNPFVINPNPDLEELAQARKWPIYWPQSLARTADKASIAK